MSSNFDQNQSQSSDQNYRRNRRHYNDVNPVNGRQYVDQQYRYLPNSGSNQNNFYNPYQQWSTPEPTNYSYFNGQPFVSNDRQFRNYSQNYTNFESTDGQNNGQSFRNNNESNKVTNHQKRYQRNQWPQQSRSRQTEQTSNPTNDRSLGNQNLSQTNSYAQEVLQNPSNVDPNGHKSDNKIPNKDNRKERQPKDRQPKEKNDRYGRSGQQRGYEESFDQRFVKNDNKSEDNRNRYERNERSGRNGDQRSHERYYDQRMSRQETKPEDNNSKQESSNRYGKTDSRSYGQNVNRRVSKHENNYRTDRFGRSNQRSYEQSVDKQSVETDISSEDKNKKISEKKTLDANRRRAKPKGVPESEESQREIIEELLRKGEFECMVCCDQIRIKDRVWSCEHCYNVFHLKCIKMWATSQTAKSQSETQNQSWRCPTCQTHHNKVPNVYYCFCGKVKEPELNRYLVPHSCGETCGRKTKTDTNRKYNCPHKCLLRCHPGSCPPCEMKVNRECGCGKTTVTVNCLANEGDVVCTQVCNKMLNCGQHFCQRVCHTGKCEDCALSKTQSCFCGKHKKEVECNIENNLIDKYCCQQMCGKDLKCGNHKCERICHIGDCNDCPLNPKTVTHCSCGKTLLTDLTPRKRQTCLDPIPNCKQICDKELICGSDKERHRCRSKCHSGACPPCDQKTVIRCRCGANSDNIDCIQLSQNESKLFICKKRCNRKRVCGRHKCLNECCIDAEHKCQQICGKKLSCGQHNCQELCHSGNCPQCWNISWDELSCQCGAEVKFPPIACGTKRPECERICSRSHACEHPIDHRCHDDDACPPCTHFTPKICFGGHESRPVPCHETGFSCGYLCGKQLDCGLHECQMICHSGDCNECTLPCNKTREDCQHLCCLKCHQKTSPDVCPKSKCKQMVKVFCDCGRKTESMPCFKVMDESSLRLSLNSLVNQRIKNGESVDVNLILKNIKDFKHIQLKCDDKCAIIERNRQLAEALDVKDADFNPEPGPPKYTELLKTSAKTDPTFVKDVYEKLTKLVMDSKQSKLSFKNLNFAPMNAENRHIIHELAEHFGCKTHAIDREPNRSVVVKAVKDKCYLPTVSLMDFVKEETESRKTNKITLKSHCFDSASNNTNPKGTALTGLSMMRSISIDSNSTNKSSAQAIDYFDFKGE